MLLLSLSIVNNSKGIKAVITVARIYRPNKNGSEALHPVQSVLVVVYGWMSERILQYLG